MLVTIATFREPYEAHMLSGRLQSEGVAAFVAHEFHVGNKWINSTALGGAKVQVLQEEASAAQAIEERCRTGNFRELLAEEFGDLDDLSCPKCGAKEVWKRRPIQQAGLIIVLFFLGTVLFPWSWVCYCDSCGKKFKSKYGLIGKASREALPQQHYFRAEASDEEEINRFASMRITAPGKIDTSHTWLCRIGGVVRGVSIADPQSRSFSLFVDSDFGRLGIGRALHDCAVNSLFEEDPGPIWATAREYGKEAKFLKAMGWKLHDEEADGSYRFGLARERWERRKSRI